MSTQNPVQGSAARGGHRAWLPRAAHPVSWWMLLITTLSILIVSIDAQILPTILPGVLADYKLSPTEGGFLNSIFFFGIVAGAMVFGILSDVLGTGYRRGYTWIIAHAVGIVGGILTWLYAGSLAWFQALRFPMGVSRGGSEPTNVALIGEWWQRENRGFAIGVHHTGFPFGQFLGPALMAVVLAFATWREVYLLIPLIGIPIIVIQLVVGTRRNQERVYGWIKERDLTPPLDTIGGRGKLQSPVASIKAALRHRNTALSILIIFLFLWAETGIYTFMTLYLTQVVHMPLAQAAVVSGASGITGWIGQVVWSTLSDRMGRKFSLGIITVGWIVATLLLMTISSATSAWVLLLFWGLFRNSPFPVVYALLIDSVQESAGSGMGLMIGIALGVSGLVVAPVAGFVIQHFGWAADYTMLAAACALALVPLYFLEETVTAEPVAVAPGARA